MRKTADFEVTQRIRTVFVATDTLAEAVTAYESYIGTETLALTTVRDEAVSDGTEWDLNGHACTIRVEPVDA
jgi:hypothetical protein